MSSKHASFSCDRHPNLPVTHICTFSKCTHTFLCASCKSAHPETHHPSTVPAAQAHAFKYDEAGNELQALRSEDDALYRQKISEIDQIFSTIKLSIENYLNEAKGALIKKLHTVEVLNDHGLDNYRYHFENLNKKILESPGSVELSKAFLEKYIEFQRKVAKLMHKREIQRQNMNFSYEEINLALQRIETTLSAFSSYFYQSKRTIEPNFFDLKSLKFDKYLEGPGESLPRSVEFIPDRNLMVIGDKQGHLTLWDSKKHIKYCCKNGHYGYINNLKYFAKRDWIISASSDGSIRVWEVTNGPNLKLIQNIKAGDKYIWGILPVEKQSLLYSCGGEPNIRIWDLNTFQLKWIINTGEKERMGRDIVFIEKYNLIVVGFQDGIIGFYDATSKNEVCIINTFNKVIISCIVYLESSNQLVAGTDLGGKITTWTLMDRCDSLYPEPEFCQEIKLGGTYAEKILPVNNQEELLVTTGSSSRVHWVNLKKNSYKSSPATKLQDCVGFALNPYDKRLILGDYKSNKLALFKY